MNTSLEDIRTELSAFADDNASVEIDQAGTVVMERLGEVVSFALHPSDTGGWEVMFDEGTISYRELLARRLGRLDILARRLLDHRDVAPGAFIESGAKLDRAINTDMTGPAIDLLEAQCASPLAFATRLTFITAQAGHGKSALLKEAQRRTAEAYLNGESPRLLWHVDLQGRQLLRLDEALAGDLGSLRFDGLWIGGVYALVRAGALVLAIDGFDELTAEQGAADAFGALSGLLRDLRGQGSVIAASRTAFFDAGDYLRRSRSMQRVLPPSVAFDQLSLDDWGDVEGRLYFREARFHGGDRVPQPEQSYDRLRRALDEQDDGQPVLTRPYLLYQVAQALAVGTAPEDFVRGMDGNSGVESVVRSFVSREVQEKWLRSTTPAIGGFPGELARQTTSFRHRRPLIPSRYRVACDENSDEALANHREERSLGNASHRDRVL